MSTGVSTTKHMTPIDPREPRILRAIRNTPGVRKIQVGEFWKGSSRTHLKLRPRMQDGLVDELVDGCLHIAGLQRELTIFPIGETALDQMADALNKSLMRHDVPVETKANYTTLIPGDMSMENGSGVPPESTRNEDDEWTLLAMIIESAHETVQRVTALDEQIDALVSERDKKKAMTLESFRSLLG